MPSNWLRRFFSSPKAHCQDVPLEELPEDHLSLDDEEMLEERNHHIPSFPYLLNPIKAMTASYPGQDVEGFRFSFGVPLSQNFLMSHTLNLSSKKSPALTGNQMFDMFADKTPFYSLGVQYHHGDLMSRNPHVSFSLFGNVDANGRLAAVFAKNLGKWKLKAMSNFPNSNFAMAQTSLEVEHAGDNNKQTATFSSQVLNYNLVERLGKKLCLGFDLTYVIPQNLWANGLALRYVARPSQRFYFQYSSMARSLTLGGYFKVNDATTMVTELEFGGPSTTDAAIGYRTKSKTYTVDSLVRTNGEIKSSFTYTKESLYKLKLFLAGNLTKEEFKSGFAFSVGQTED
jgi:hypothetical protein